ncbi:hypothetical protein [Methyloceanibacter sp.]|uniref:hypothetical protein n=1 Tax=Methyloceanibacter sp. TaxID=1965321 RepID=UPI003D6D6CEE
MMRVWPFLMLLLAGCAAEPAAQATGSVEVYQRVSLAPQQAQLVYSGVQRVLSDPASAQFGQIFAGRKPDGTVYVCGSVNARTSSGALTGDQPFYGTLDQRAFTPIKIGGTEEQSRAIQAYCRQTLALG